MNFNRISIVLLPRYGVLLFFAFTVISMILYGGGTINDPDTVGYSFTHNFFSDLGKFSTKNFISMVFFTGSLSVTGITFSIYFYNFMKYYSNDSLGIMSKSASVLGIVGALCFAGVGFTPHNLFNDIHIIFVNWAFRSFLISAILFTIVLYKDERFSNHYAIGYCMFAVSIFLYILVLEFGPDAKSSDVSLIFNVLTQKVIILIFMLSVLYQSFGNSKLAANNSFK